MAIFDNYTEFASSTIEENLAVAKYSIETPKGNNNSCYGMPALILLASCIDTMGTLYDKKGNFGELTKDVVIDRRGKTREHYENFYHKFIDKQQYNKEIFIKDFYELCRCKATHNGVLGMDIFITKNGNDNSLFVSEDNIVKIHLPALYDLVKEAYAQMKKDANLSTNEKEEQEPETGKTTDTKTIR
ncbi:MAG: hypothetical protein Q4E49_03630 [Bacteroidales bacterium]|nr:hypothetical protein [Bacteroidales bacterium]